MHANDKTHAAGLRALAVAFPSVVRTNDWWREHSPELVASAEQHALARIWSRSDGAGPPTAFDVEMEPYLADPFRGAVARRWRAPGETALTIELAAARGALGAANVDAKDVDLTLVSSFPADRLGVGDASFLARELGLRGPAWNFESACASSVVGLHMAASFVESGRYARVLVVASTSNSILSAPDDTLSWFVGDGAGAMIVERQEGERGVLGACVKTSTDTNDMFRIEALGDRRFTTHASENASRIARDTAEPYLRACVAGALQRSGLRLEDIDFFVFNTPTAWYGAFCARALGVRQDRFHSVYPRYANVGAALMPATLFHAALEGRVKPGDKVLLYAIGSTSTAAALVIRWGDVALGPPPA